MVIMTSIIYSVGDYVYAESTPTSPCAVRKILALYQSEGGWHKAKVQCFYRRNELVSNSLISIADRQLRLLQDACRNNGETLTDIQWHQLKHRELFLGYENEVISTNSFRGKCYVSYYNELEFLHSYIDREDTFFYRMVFDHVQKSLFVPYKEIRLGPKYQASIPPFEGELSNQTDSQDGVELDTLMWSPHHNLNDNNINKYLIVARAVGTFARALDSSSMEALPLRQAAATASRDITHIRALEILFSKSYNLVDAMNALIPSSGVLLCRDQLEEWSSAETQMFVNALQTYGKHFGDIREYILPWKSLSSIVEYYYTWKTSNMYYNIKAQKRLDEKSGLQSVPHELNGSLMEFFNSFGAWTHNNTVKTWVCASCAITFTGRCYVWGNKENKICGSCWMYWKKYGGLKLPSKVCLPDTNVVARSCRCLFVNCLMYFDSKLQLARHYSTTHRVDLKHYMPTRSVPRKHHPFFLHTTRFNRISRRLCHRVVHPKRAARNPYKPINMTLVKQECANQMSQKSPEEILEMLAPKPKISSSINVYDFFRRMS